ncbi:MAG: glycosyltransferase family 2 protein [Bacteroidales bacterium]|nr:glycosyltransferase family 2 protein [Bacteroidales bacterium]
MIELSVVVTLFNEEENIRPLLEMIPKALAGYTYEVVFVDDGSTDNTVAEIKKLSDKHVRLLRLTRNYGQSIAMIAGIDFAEGEFIALLDGDLQNDPSDIPFMLEKLKVEGWDVVAGTRRNRKDGIFFRKVPSWIANSLIRRYTGVHIQDYGCTLKVFRCEIAKNLDLYGELHRFIPVLASLKGARITQVDVHHHPRKFGRSKYGINRTFKVASDLILILFLQRYLRKPMHLFGGMGILLLIPGGAILFYLLIIKILGNDIWGKPLLILGVLLVILGILFIMMGIMTELLMRIYYGTGNRKLYVVKEVFNGRQ